MRRNNRGFVILVSTLLFAVSCNFIYSPIHGRENPNDQEAVLTSLLAVQPQAEEVMVSFPWRELYYDYYNDNEKIEEAMLVYSVGKAIPIRVAPLPSDSGGIFGFEFDESPVIFSKSIYNLNSGEDVWFALYPKTKNKWLAPLYEKISVRDIADIPTVSGAGPFTPEKGATMDEGGWFDQDDLVSGSNYTVGTNCYLVLRFNLPDRIRCLYASLQLSVPMNNGSDNAMIYPVCSLLFENMNDNERGDMVDINNGSSFLVSEAVSALGADITDAVNAAVVYGSDIFVIQVDGGAADWTDTYGSETITLDYEQY